VSDPQRTTPPGNASQKRDEGGRTLEYAWSRTVAQLELLAGLSATGTAMMQVADSEGGRTFFEARPEITQRDDTDRNRHGCAKSKHRAQKPKERAPDRPQERGAVAEALDSVSGCGRDRAHAARVLPVGLPSRAAGSSGNRKFRVSLRTRGCGFRGDCSPNCHIQQQPSGARQEADSTIRLKPPSGPPSLFPPLPTLPRNTVPGFELPSPFWLPRCEFGVRHFDLTCSIGRTGQMLKLPARATLRECPLALHSSLHVGFRIINLGTG